MTMTSWFCAPTSVQARRDLERSGAGKTRAQRCHFGSYVSSLHAAPVDRLLTCFAARPAGAIPSNGSTRNTSTDEYISCYPTAQQLHTRERLVVQSMQIWKYC